MGAFTDAELDYLGGQRLARVATAGLDGTPDVSAVGFGVDGDSHVLSTGGFDITKTIRYRHLRENPVATIVVDDLATVDPWAPRGVKVRGRAELVEESPGRWSIRIHPEVVWSWGINVGAETYFAGRIEKRVVDS